jgi:mxaC protein
MAGAMAGLAFDQPWALLLLLLAVLPWRGGQAPTLRSGWLAHAPVDRASTLLDAALRAAAVLAVVALAVALAGPHLPEYTVQRTGQGAEVVLLLDRSRSMDQGFAPGQAPPADARANNAATLDFYFSQSPARLKESKGQVARRLLSEFTAQRPDDRFALVVFSTLPLHVFDFTDKPEFIQAGIGAGDVGRGLSETNIGTALGAALDAFDGRPYSGSRIVMLVSDGGDRLDSDTRERLARQVREQRVSIYWLYLRTANSPTLQSANAGTGTDNSNSTAMNDSVPELLLHNYFQSLGVPYRAYEASDTHALERAIADVNRSEKLPIVQEDTVPRRDLSPWAHGLALLCVLLLLAAQALELRRWD